MIQDSNSTDNVAITNPGAVKWMMLPLSPVIAILTGYAAYRWGGMELLAAKTLSIALWTALWWIFEPVPIPVTSLLPLALLPMFGVLTDKQVAMAYGHKLVLLLMGGFLLSKAMEKSGVHRRLALMMVNLCGGGGGRGLVLGFMLAAAMLSMWISNTATTLMLLPMALAILEGAKDRRVTIPLLLGIAYAANVGGLGTPIGTTPNLVFIEQYKEFSGEEFSFSDWMKHGIPVVFCMVPLIWLWLTRNLKDAAPLQLPKVGTWRQEEVRTLIIFAMTAIAWATRKEPFGGWSEAFGVPGVNDASVAFISVIFLFCLPSGMRKGDKLLDWETAVKIPWGLLLLFGGGIAIASAFKTSGLSEIVAGLLTGLQDVPVFALIFIICLVVTFLTEMTSNTATTILLMPILGAAAKATNVDPAILMLPAVLSASCAFMLPVATAPNAVVFGTGKFSTTRMMREGFALNLIGTFIISCLCCLMLR